MRTAGNSVFISERERPEVRVKDEMIVPGRHLGKECYKNQIWIRKADLRGTTRIAQEAFAGCTNLRLVRFKILKMLGRYTFSGCVRLKEIEFPESLEQMGAGAFMNNKRLESVWFQNGRGMEELPPMAFGGCSALSDVQLPKRLRSIGRRAFYKCEKLNGMELPLQLKYIGTEAFYGCNIEELELPEGLLEIGEGAFRKCRRLEYVYLPDTLRRIGKWTFHGCTRLAVLEARHDPEEIGEWITNKGCIIRCPKGSRMEAYARSYGMTVEYV
jgi:hypothetical protein